MTRRDDTISLRHMCDHAAEAVVIARGRSRSDLDDDRMLVLALTKLVEIVGEAANRISTATRESQPGVPWSQIIGTRNRLVHGYDQVDLDVLWCIAAVEMPRLLEHLRAILAERS